MNQRIREAASRVIEQNNVGSPDFTESLKFSDEFFSIVQHTLAEAPLLTDRHRAQDPI